jgi:membrane-bound lytic murein transglycosylase B
VRTFGAGAKTRGASSGNGRHAARRRPGTGRVWRRWLVLGAAAAALAAVLAPTPSGNVSPAAKSERAAQPRWVPSERAIEDLSAGAPASAVTLTNTPLHVPQPQAADALISGLASNGIPVVALNAYRVAAARMGSADPGCGIDWSLLAGIGRVESNHGRFGGAVLDTDGTSNPRILGPALNGQGFAFIRDTDRGVYDGDSVTDRAVGPMQFIPATWRSYAIDGDGNGTTDPFNINDAALAAAHYLCVAGGNLTTDAGQRRAVMAYNHSDSYVAEVLALAHAYASGIPVADLPPISGNTSGAVPAPGPSYAHAPASPGPAIGAQDTTAPSGDTVGAQPAAQPAGQPAPQAPSESSGGGTQTPAGGSGSTAGGGPAPSGGGSTVGSSGTGTGMTGGSGTTSGGTSALPVPAPPVTLPPVITSPPVPLPAPPPPPALVENLKLLPPLTVPVPGVNCHTKLLGLITLPLCPG